MIKFQADNDVVHQMLCLSPNMEFCLHWIKDLLLEQQANGWHLKKLLHGVMVTILVKVLLPLLQKENLCGPIPHVQEKVVCRYSFYQISLSYELLSCKVHIYKVIVYVCDDKGFNDVPLSTLTMTIMHKQQWGEVSSKSSGVSGTGSSKCEKIFLQRAISLS